MKKILFAISIVCVCLLSACATHTHKAGMIRHNEDYHWYECVDSGCSERIKKAEHTWGEGKVSQQDSKITYTCSVCNRTKSKDYVVIGGETEEKDWKKGFFSEVFSNVTATITESFVVNKHEKRTVYNIQGSDSKVYVTITQFSNGEETSYIGKYQEGNLLWTMNNKNTTVENATLSTITGSEIMDTRKILSNYRIDLADRFGEFKYNSKTMAYEATDVTLSGQKYESIEVYILNKQIQKIVLKDTVEGVEHTVEMTFSNYGKTTPTPPTASGEGGTIQQK